MLGRCGRHGLEGTKPEPAYDISTEPIQAYSRTRKYRLETNKKTETRLNYNSVLCARRRSFLRSALDGGELFMWRYFCHAGSRSLAFKKCQCLSDNSGQPPSPHSLLSLSPHLVLGGRVPPYDRGENLLHRWVVSIEVRLLLVFTQT